MTITCDRHFDDRILALSGNYKVTAYASAEIVAPEQP
jgi:hypothetical protein